MNLSRRLLLTAALPSAPTRARAQAIPFATTNILPTFRHCGWGLQDPTQPQPTPIIYSKTAEKISWRISQWGIGGQRLPGWVFRPKSHDWYSSTPAAEVSVSAKRWTATLSQNGAVMACGNPHAPSEFDMFIAPDKMPQIDLDTNQVTGFVDAQIQFAVGGAKMRCPISQAGSAFCCVLLHKPSLSTLFYQYHLRGTTLNGDKLQQGWWPDNPIWFSKNKPFGVDDFSLPRSQSMLSDRFRISIDISDRIRATLSTMASLPQKGWLLTGMYAGQSIWGDVSAKSTWYELQLTTRHR